MTNAPNKEGQDIVVEDLITRGPRPFVRRIEEYSPLKGIYCYVLGTIKIGELIRASLASTLSS